MARLYQRRAELIIGSHLFETAKVQDGRLQPSLRFQFRITRALEREANTAEATIFGLNDATRGLITGIPRQAEALRKTDKTAAAQAAQFVVEAGYEDTAATLFAGQIARAYTQREGTTIATKVEAADGLHAARARIAASFAPGAPVGEMIAAIARKMNINATKAIARALAGDFNGGITTLFNGAVLSGTAGDELSKLGETLGFDWSVENGVLLLLKPKEVQDDLAVKLTPSSGLVGSPRRTFDEKRSSAFLVQARSLLNPRIQPGRQVEIESSEISGFFKVSKATHQGDTHGPDWFSELEGSGL